MRSVLGYDALQKFRSNLPNVVDETYEPLFHIQTYNAAAGHSTLTFFQTQVGAAGVTLDDTNMEIPSQIPSNKAFIATGISVAFLPGAAIATTAAAAAADGFIRDVNAIARTGNLQFTIGPIVKLRLAPIGAFPPGWGLNGFGAETTTVAATNTTIGYAGFAGRMFELVPVEIPANQNFKVELAWPTANVLLPSTVNARIGVYIHGHSFRLGV